MEIFISIIGTGDVSNVDVEQGSLIKTSKFEVIVYASTAAVNTNE